MTAPEMFTVGRGDVRADIFSAGVTFYRLLTNEWPFGDEETDPDELATLITTTEPRHLRDLAPHVPGVMSRTVHRALRRDPTERYADWRAMHAALAPRTVPRDWREQAAHPRAPSLLD